MDVIDTIHENGIMFSGKFYEIAQFENLFNEIVRTVTEKVLENVNESKDGSAMENFTVKEIAMRVKKANSTITRHCQIGLLPAHKVGKSWLISKDGYEKYITNDKSLI